MKQKRFILPVLLCLVTATMLLLRIREQTNYGQVHVRVSGDSSSAVASILAVGPGGSLTKLVRRDDDAAIFSQFGATGPVHRIHVVTRPGVTQQTVVEEIRVGENWCTPSWQVPIVEGPIIVPLPAELQQAELRPAITEYVPGRFSSLNFLDVHRAINWQGDFWLLLTPCVEAAVMIVVPWLLYCLLRPIIVRSLGTSIPEQDLQRLNSGRGLAGLVSRGVLYLVMVFVIILVIHQLYWQIPDFHRIRWGNQFLVSFLLLLVLGCAVRAYCSRITRLVDDRARIRTAGLLLLGVGLIKLLWISGVDTAQTGDYQKYADYGIQMASDDWNSFSDREHTGFLIFLRRAFVWTYPLSLGVVRGFIQADVVNVALQLGSTALFGWLVSRMFSVSVACCSIPFFVLYPGFWYAPTIMSHNTPGYFWMLAAWCSFEKLRQSASDCLSNGRVIRHWVTFLMWCLTLGICCGLMELTKSLNQVLVASLGLIAGLELLRRLASGGNVLEFSSHRSGLLFCGGMLVALLISGQTLKLVDEQILQKAGNISLPSVSFVDHILGVDSETDGSAIWVNWWKRDYFPLLRGALKEQLAVRKILHEKLTCGIQAFLGVLRRNHFYSLQSMDYAWRAFGGRAGSTEGAQEVYRVPWCGMQRRLIQGTCLLLLFCTAARILLCPMFPITAAELFPLCFSVGGYLAIVLLAEAAPYYGEIGVFPMIWSTGLIVERFCRLRNTMVLSHE